MTYQLYAPALPEVEQQFMPATNNLVLGLLEAAVDDIVSMFVFCGDATEEFLYHLWLEIQETTTHVLSQLQTKRK